MLCSRETSIVAFHSSSRAGKIGLVLARLARLP
jgi:hypothetical protein